MVFCSLPNTGIWTLILCHFNRTEAIVRSAFAPAHSTTIRMMAIYQ